MTDLVVHRVARQFALIRGGRAVLPEGRIRFVCGVYELATDRMPGRRPRFAGIIIVLAGLALVGLTIVLGG